jgi:hypothetical protein
LQEETKDENGDIADQQPLHALRETGYVENTRQPISTTE